MPEKEWTIPFGDFALILRRVTVAGKVTSFAAVLIVSLDGKWQDITRYDTAHGFAHRDVLGRREGLRGKLIMPTLNYNHAFRYAIRDLKENANAYLADFLAH